MEFEIVTKMPPPKQFLPGMNGDNGYRFNTSTGAPTTPPAISPKEANCESEVKYPRIS